MRIDLDPNNLLEELKKYVGKHVETHSEAPKDMVLRYGREYYDFGGDCGILQEVFEENNEVWVQSDWGMG